MNPKERKAFSMIARFASSKHAFRGIGIFVRSTHNAWVEICASLVAIILGFYFSISSGEWLAVVLSIGVLLMAEAFNTAMEVDMDLTHPGVHPMVRDTKDIAAGAVLISALMTLVVFLIIFVPPILALFQ